MSVHDKEPNHWSLNTVRLTIRPAIATTDDINFLYRLWTNPEVMRFVGFPGGLQTSHSEIKKQLDQYANQFGNGEFDRVLLVCRDHTDDTNETIEIIGECKLGFPDDCGVAKTDVKFLPEFQGMGYGKEVKKKLVEYLFTRTDCRSILATPNQLNIASVKMQEAVGAKRVGDGCHQFPDNMKSFTCDVPYFEYEVRREDWETGRS